MTHDELPAGHDRFSADSPTAPAHHHAVGMHLDKDVVTALEKPLPKR
ncbi:hypothetical protein [uncultured Streptomyces sp.]|nr:hypothetical protein [uncultured Streptomyces sp.]